MEVGSNTFSRSKRLCRCVMYHVQTTLTHSQVARNCHTSRHRRLVSAALTVSIVLAVVVVVVVAPVTTSRLKGKPDVPLLPVLLNSSDSDQGVERGRQDTARDRPKPVDPLPYTATSNVEVESAPQVHWSHHAR